MNFEYDTSGERSLGATKKVCHQPSLPISVDKLHANVSAPAGLSLRSEIEIKRQDLDFSHFDTKEVNKEEGLMSGWKGKPRVTNVKPTLTKLARLALQIDGPS